MTVGPDTEARDFWDQAAAGFDAEPDHGLRDPLVRAAWLALLRSHLPAPPADVLDLGCGTGSLTVLLAVEGHRVRGVDFAPRMVDAARAKLAAAGCEATVEEGDAADPPGEPHSYDVVLTRHVIWALPDPAAAVARWVRLLRPGGRLVLVEGRWWTGGGLSASRCRSLVAPHAAWVTVVALDDPRLWGGPVDDERYLLVAGLSPS